MTSNSYRRSMGVHGVVPGDRLALDGMPVTITDTSTNVPASLATLIRDTRTRRGLTQMDVANVVGVSQPYIGHLENGRQVPTAPATIQALANALGIDADAIYAAAGRVPDDLARRLASDQDAVRIVRQALDMRNSDTGLTL